MDGTSQLGNTRRKDREDSYMRKKVFWFYMYRHKAAIHNLHYIFSSLLREGLSVGQFIGPSLLPSVEASSCPDGLVISKVHFIE